MKGTFFSADFVRDFNDDLRLIEINTDTGIIKSQKSMFDWTEFFGILEQNNINELIVVYKHSIQSPIIESLSSHLEENAPFIVNFRPILVDEDSIFPTIPPDALNRFILRMAYDETAILDSEYAKGTLNLLKLFVDGNESQSVVNFYHSSLLNGRYDTLDENLINGDNLPDVIVKTTVEEHNSHNFYKIGKPELTTKERFEDFLSTINDNGVVIQQYHYSPDAIESNENRVSSIRSFHIVYGSNLEICSVAEYEIMSVLDLPTSVEYDETKLVNKLSNKHYYEFATNHIKNIRHGFLGDTEILDASGNEVEIRDVKVGGKFKSYFIESSPNTDDENVIRDWSFDGDTLPGGSYPTLSTVMDTYKDETYTNEMTLITFGENEQVYLGGETRLLTYDEQTDSIKYQRVLDISVGDGILKSTGDLAIINSIETVIFEEPQLVYALNLEDVDNFILATQNIHGFSMSTFFTISHNCFVAGTKVTLADGVQKNIEDVVFGDIIDTFNEVTKNAEPKYILDITSSINTKFVKYTFSNGTEITSTREHPFYVFKTNDVNDRWVETGFDIAAQDPETTSSIHNIEVETKQINVGDRVLLVDHTSVEITNIEEFETGGTDVYIIKVADNHNFYANSILVHNK